MQTAAHRRADATPPAMLWLALHLPQLPLEAWCATLPEAVRQGPQARPRVLIAEHRVSHLDAVAAAHGIRAGMKRATALALAADLLPGSADAARDAAALLAVAHAALAFTPAVTLHDEASVLLEVQASLRLFGGPATLVARLRQALAPLGHRVRVAAAPTALGAALLARWQAAEPGAGQGDPQEGLADDAPGAPGAVRHRGAGARDPLFGPHATQLAALRQRLDAAPVWLLGPGRQHWQALQGMGLQTLGDLRALPRAGLARRFGESLLDDLDRALGLRADPRRWLELPAQFESRLELFARAETTEQVLAGAAVLLARLVAWAQGRHGRIGEFTLSMRHEPAGPPQGRIPEGEARRCPDEPRHGADAGFVPATDLRIELAEPALDPAHLQLLLRERLARVVLAAPTLELRLHCRHLVAGAAPNGELFPSRQSEQQGLRRLLERLRARLGDAQVQRLQPLADHRPERASRAVPALPAAALPLHRPGLVERGALPLHRPAFLLAEPLPLAERGALPLLDGRELQLVSGPERIESGWWDGDLVVRDYFIGAAEDGSLVWLWRGRLPAGVGESQWFLQGRFA